MIVVSTKMNAMINIIGGKSVMDLYLTAIWGSYAKPHPSAKKNTAAAHKDQNRFVFELFIFDFSVMHQRMQHRHYSRFLGDVKFFKITANSSAEDQPPNSPRRTKRQRAKTADTVVRFW